MVSTVVISTILAVGLVAAMKLTTQSASAATMMSGNASSGMMKGNETGGKMMSGNASSGMMKGNETGGKMMSGNQTGGMMKGNMTTPPMMPKK